MVTFPTMCALSLRSKKISFWISADGRKEKVMFDKITSRIQKLVYGLNDDFVDPVSILFLLSKESYVEDKDLGGLAPVPHQSTCIWGLMWLVAQYH